MNALVQTFNVARDYGVHTTTPRQKCRDAFNMNEINRPYQYKSRHVHDLLCYKCF